MISLKLVAMVKHWTQLGKNVSVICVRENASYLRDSVYSQIKWALDMLSLYDEYKFILVHLGSCIGVLEARFISMAQMIR